jgi:hypothetical protein
MAKVLEGVDAVSASGNAYKVYDKKEFLAAMRTIVGYDVGTVIIPEKGAPRVMVFEAKAKPAVAPKISTGAAGKAFDPMENLSAKEKDYCRAWAKAIGEGRGELGKVVARLQGIVKALVDAAKAEEELTMPEEEELTMPASHEVTTAPRTLSLPDPVKGRGQLGRKRAAG